MMMAASVRKDIVNLPLGAKLKFSSGKKFVVQAKNVAGHEANCVTLVGEFVTENHKWNNTHNQYNYCSIHKTILPRYYNELNQIEKNEIIYRTFNSGTNSQGHTTPGWRFQEVQSYFWIPSGAELGLSTGKGANIGFSDHASRKKTLENGSPSGYYTTSGYTEEEWDVSQNDYYVYVINSSGAEEKRAVYSWEKLTNFTTGILPCCDIKGTTKCKKGSDGYWRIVEK